MRRFAKHIGHDRIANDRARVAARCVRTSCSLAIGLVAISSAPASAQSWPSRVLTFADCNPANSSGGMAYSASQTCNANGVTANAKASFTSLKSGVDVGKSASSGTYAAAATADESAMISLKDGTPGVTKGTLTFTYGFDGTLSARPASYPYAQGSNVGIGMYEYVYNGPNVAASLVYADKFTFDFTAKGLDSQKDYQPFMGGRDYFLFSNPYDEAIYLKGNLSFTFDVISGKQFYYETFLYNYAYEPGSFANFLSTTTLSKIEARDSMGNLVDLDFNAASGASYAGIVQGGPSAVPEPATWAMMLIGMGAAAGAMRRQRRGSASGRAMVA